MWDACAAQELKGKREEVLHMTRRRKRVDRGIARLQKGCELLRCKQVQQQGGGVRGTGRHIERLVKMIR